MLLNKLFENAPSIKIDELCVDSRVHMHNAIFFCLSGIKYNGHDFVDEAVKNGAIVIVYDEEIKKNAKAIYIKVKNVNDTLIRVGNIFYDNPQDSLEKYLVCGNYGKSSVSNFINYYLNLYKSCGYIGNFGIKYKNTSFTNTYTTLNTLDNLKMIKTMKDENIDAVTFEANASSLNLKKLDVINPDVFIYTCTNEESRDYRQGDYFSYIRRYLYTLDNDTKIILNRDDFSFDEIKESIDRYFTYGISNEADYHIENIKLSINKSTFDLRYNEQLVSINSKLIGIVNVYNITAAIAALHQSGYDLNDIVSKFSNLFYIDGVMEKLDSKFNIIIDCAYDLNSIEKVCEFAKKTKVGKTICVVGINYSDDDNRIKKIVKILENYIDIIIFTEDESLQGEVMSILERCDKFTQKNNSVHYAYRSYAIKNAIELMNKDDTLLIIGKGNEKYLIKGLGKDYYEGDKYYAEKHLKSFTY